ncbi:MAG: hypothetical protein LBF97_00935 [Elusimicrobiota bacterium]|jgi:hypothetical protein|nr:hypothetical protein [Elusimicrobiota bacterium]
MNFNEVVLLLEWKEDLKRGNVLLHYTDANGLINILKTKTLKKKWYDFNQYALSDRIFGRVNNGYAYLKDGTKVKRAELMDEKSEVRKKQFGEIALARPSSNYVLKTHMSKKQEQNKQEQLKKFSGKNNIAELILYTDNIKSSVRNIKHSKIAEYNLKWWRKLQFLFGKLEELFESVNAVWAMKKYDFTAKLLNIKDIKFVHKEWDREKKGIVSYFFKNFKNEEYLTMSSLYKEIENSFENFNKSEINKEGEERFTEDIPLDKKFIQIRLLNYIFEIDKEEIRELHNLIKRNSYLFVSDSTYKKFINLTT